MTGRRIIVDAWPQAYASDALAIVALALFMASIFILCVVLT